MLKSLIAFTSQDRMLYWVSLHKLLYLLLWQIIQSYILMICYSYLTYSLFIWCYITSICLIIKKFYYFIVSFIKFTSFMSPTSKSLLPLQTYPVAQNSLPSKVRRYNMVYYIFLIKVFLFI